MLGIFSIFGGSFYGNNTILCTLIHSMGISNALSLKNDLNSHGLNYLKQFPTFNYGLMLAYVSAMPLPATKKNLRPIVTEMLRGL